jgi:hypothetical protein
MTNKKILSIDIDDARFRQFYELFQQYQVDVENMPEEWKVLNESANDANEAIAAVAGMLVENLLNASSHAKELVQHLQEASSAQTDFVTATGAGENSLKKMGKEARDFAETLFGIGKFLMKLDVIGTVTGAGSLWGMDKLAGSAIEYQRQARGLGLTPGQLRAFDTDFGSRYVNEGELNSIADARNDLTKRIWLQKATGLSSDQIDSTDVGTLAGLIKLKEHDWWASTPASQHNIQFLQATGFPQIGQTLDEVRQSGNTYRGELTRGLSQYQEDARKLNVNDSNTDALYDFKRQLMLAGQTLETDLTNKLAELNRSGALSGFIHALGDDAKILIDDALKPETLNKFKDALGKTTNFLGSPDFQKDLELGASAMKDFAEVTVGVAEYLKKHFPNQSDFQTAKDILDDPLGGSHKDDKDKNKVDHVLDWLHNRKQKYDSFWHDVAGSPIAAAMASQSPFAARFLADTYGSTSHAATDEKSKKHNLID